MLERKPASERRLAEQQHGARVLVAGGDFAERRERRRVRRPFAELGERAGNEIALADGVEDLDRAHDFEPGEGFASVRGRSGGGRTHDVLETEPGAGDLAVIGGRIASRRLVMRARLVVPAERLRGAALPIAGARERDRVAGALADLGEVARAR